MKIKQPNTLKDALYFLSPDSGPGITKAQGVLIGSVSTLMAISGEDFETVWRKYITPNLPSTIEHNRIPDSWRESLKL